MDVELLVVPHCPGIDGALALAETALDALGLDTQVTLTVISSERQAQARNFVGSPTFLVDGLDPFTEPGASIGVACRLYRTPDGLAGLPDVEVLLEALRAAASIV